MPRPPDQVLALLIRGIRGRGMGTGRRRSERDIMGTYIDM